MQRWLASIVDVWWPAGAPWRHAAEDIKRAYRVEIDRTHGARARMSYAILSTLAAGGSVLEYRQFPDRLLVLIIGCGIVISACVLGTWLLTRSPAWTNTVTVFTNNLLGVSACVYYAAVRGSAEMCALTLVFFMVCFLFFTPTGTAQFLSSLSVFVAFPWALGRGMVASSEPEFLIGAVVLAALLTAARAALIDAQRFAAFDRGEALRRSEANLRGIFDNLRDVFFRISRHGTIEMISPSVTQLGYRPEDLIGRSARALYHNPGAFPIVQGQLIETSGRGAFELTIHDRQGNPVPVSINAHVNVDADGTFAGIEGVLRDISERKRADEDARQHQAQLAHVARLSTLGEMAAGVAHELHQPLAAIVNFTSGCEHRLRADPHPRPDVLHALEQISAQALRAGEIIRRIRQFIRKEEPSIEWVDINARVRNVAAFCQPDARAGGVDVQLDLAPALPPIRGNGIQIEQVLLNLIRNGFEAMQTNNGTAKRLAIRTTLRGAGIEVAVVDNGSGLTAEVAEKVFDPFFSTKANGLGLGLGISRSIVEEHGGRLLVEIDPTRGTIFRFTLPLPGA